MFLPGRQSPIGCSRWHGLGPSKPTSNEVSCCGRYVMEAVKVDKAGIFSARTLRHGQHSLRRRHPPSGGPLVYGMPVVPITVEDVLIRSALLIAGRSHRSWPMRSKVPRGRCTLQGQSSLRGTWNRPKLTQSSRGWSLRSQPPATLIELVSDSKSKRPAANSEPSLLKSP